MWVSSSMTYHQGQKYHTPTQVSVSPYGFQLVPVVSHFTPSSLLHCLPCGLRVPASNTKTTIWQTLLCLLPQLPHGPAIHTEPWLSLSCFSPILLETRSILPCSMLHGSTPLSRALITIAIFHLLVGLHKEWLPPLSDHSSWKQGPCSCHSRLYPSLTVCIQLIFVGCMGMEQICPKPRWSTAFLKEGQHGPARTVWKGKFHG